MSDKAKAIRVAILDLNAGMPNQGMRCIRDILNRFSDSGEFSLQIEEFEVRVRNRIPDLSFDIYLSSGGPGSPLPGQDGLWGSGYFSLLDKLLGHNLKDGSKKFGFFICHSFQLVCRHTGLGRVCRRKSPSFGVFPVHKTEEGLGEPLFKGLPDPFYVVESRDWQVIGSSPSRLEESGARVLALEKERPRIPLERALMAIRFSGELFGTQFHPEADPVGMGLYLETDEKKRQVIRHHGLEKYQDMLEQLHHPAQIQLTQQTLIPAFLDQAVRTLRGVPDSSLLTEH